MIASRGGIAIIVGALCLAFTSGVLVGSYVEEHVLLKRQCERAGGQLMGWDRCRRVTEEPVTPMP